MRSKILWTAALLLLLALVLFIKFGGRQKTREIPLTPVPSTAPQISSPTAAAPSIAISTGVAPIKIGGKKPAKPSQKAPVPAPGKAAVPPALLPPPVELHEELIPKNIEIVRFYYEHPISAPGSALEFEINGSGFTAEFEKMIAVKSGHPEISVKALNLMTPNQIHGLLTIGKEVKTGFVFPQVLIQGKVVFQAPDPFAVIRPGEVLNLVFTEMEEGGRSGWFRVYTNLTDSMLKNFKVAASTPGIEITDTKPELPFIVDSRLAIGWQVPEGTYDLFVQLKNKKIWERKGVIQVIKPNVGAAGLVQKVITQDGFERPGDKVKLILQGSGFQPNDVNLLASQVENFEDFKGSFTYVAPGRMDLTINIPLTAPVTNYNLGIFQGDKRLFYVAPAFTVVGKNWLRSLDVEPALAPGNSGSLKLHGRDLEKEFVEKIQIELDEPALSIGKFSYVDPETAEAPISAGPAVRPGDYWLKMTIDGKTVTPQMGSIIQIKKS